MRWIKCFGKRILCMGINHKFVRVMSSLLYQKMDVGCFRGLYDYCVEQNSIIKVFDNKTHIGRAPSANEDELENQKKFCDVTSYIVYLSKLNEVTITGWSDIIRKDKLLLTDRFVYDRNDFDRYQPRWILETRKNVGLYFEYKKKEYIAKGIYLVKMWSENWTHFLVETISRLQFLNEFPQYDDYPILIDEHLFNDERNVEVINIFNSRNHPIIKIRKDTMYEVDELIYPSQFSWFLFDKKKSEDGKGWAIVPDFLRQVRNTFWNYFNKDLLPKDRQRFNYYLARGNNKRLANEDEVISYFKEKGFRIVDTSEMTLKEEVECFMNAKAIVCMMGSGLANIIFCEEDISVFEFCPLKLQYDSFAMIGDPLGIKNYHRINVDMIIEGEQIAESRLFVPIKKLEQIVKVLEKDELVRANK